MIEDYPYGRLRCKRRVWLESDAKRGFRFVAQTENPKNGRWNAPHKSTYGEIAACLYLDNENHVQWANITPLTDAPKALEFVQDFGNKCLGADNLRTWAFKKALYANKCAKGEIGFYINGVKEPWSEADTARHIREAELWSEVVRLLGEG
jgi:hypothetical protein